MPLSKIFWIHPSCSGSSMTVLPLKDTVTAAVTDLSQHLQLIKSCPLVFKRTNGSELKHLCENNYNVNTTHSTMTWLQCFSKWVSERGTPANIATTRKQNLDSMRQQVSTTSSFFLFGQHFGTCGRREHHQIV